nr:hypothetical protein [uncultured Halomonas sp.]
MAASMTPERLSIMIGVLAAIVATLPRYIVGGHQGQLALIALAFVAVAVVSVAAFRMLSHAARRRLPALLARLLGTLVLGGVIVASWQWIQGDVDGLLLLSHGATVGLLLHALLAGWRRDSR